MKAKIVVFAAVISFVSVNLFGKFTTYFFNDEPQNYEFKTNNHHNNEICTHLFNLPLKNDIPLTSYRKFDVLSYSLTLDWYNPLKNEHSLDSSDFIWLGINQIKVKSIDQNQPLSELVFDAVELKIDSVKIRYPLISENFQKITPTPRIQRDTLRIVLPTPINFDDSIEVQIYYRFTSFKNMNNYRGFYLYPKGMFIGRLPAPFYDSVFVEEKLAYTMSEPQDARYWMPCNDSPHDKADASISVIVPKGFVVASNGYLESIQDIGDTAQIYHWISDKPITTYLMSVSASKFVKYSDWYKKVTNPNDSIEIQYYVWAKDYLSTKTDGSEYNARQAFKYTPLMMETYSKTFIEYPFIKYGMVSLMPFNFGGMEHQTITAVNRVWLRLFSYGGIAHELAHHWIGNLVTCATWNDIWFNEGGATWSEALWWENVAGKQYYNSTMLSFRSKYLKDGGLELPAIYGLPINTIFGSYATLVYQKASWIYHMLKNQLGDSTFFQIFRQFLQDYSYKSVTTNEIKEYFKAKYTEPTIDFDVFFEQWLFRAGHPKFEINCSIHSYPNSNGNYSGFVVIDQTQSGNNVPNVFQTPVKLLFHCGEQIEEKVFFVKSRTEAFDFELNCFPDSFAVDTTYILCQIENKFLSVQQLKIPKEAQFVLQPTSGKIFQLLANLQGQSKITIEVFNSIGQILDKFSDLNINNNSFVTTIDFSRYSSGFYYVRIIYGNQQKIIPVIIE